MAAALRAADPDGLLLAATLRRAFDLLLDGQHTGRYRWDQLHKTEKTHAGTLVEIGLQRTFGLADGAALDYSIAGVEVDCKFSQRSGGWMIPPEAEGYLLLLVQASDEEGTWSAGLVRARDAYLPKRATVTSSARSTTPGAAPSNGSPGTRRCPTMPCSGCPSGTPRRSSAARRDSRR